MASIVELRGVDKVYPGVVDTQVLFGIDLVLEQASFNSIVGESGSGKSTLLNILGTLDRPTRGEVVIDGKRTATMGGNRLAELRNSTIGFVFQFHYLLPEFTAMENVLMPYLIGRRKLTSGLRDRAEELFELAGISRVKNNLVTRMSGGQQQRTAVVRALVNDPRLVLADEPTGNLDSQSSANIQRIFREMNTRYGTTFVIVTHDRRVAKQTDRIIEMQDGRISMDVTK